MLQYLEKLFMNYVCFLKPQGRLCVRVNVCECVSVCVCVSVLVC